MKWMLSIEKGQLTCGDYYGRSVTVRFDEKPARRFRVSEPADHSSTMVFINNEKSFIAEAKKAKKILIQAIVYQNGSPVFEFDTAGLEWKQCPSRLSRNVWKERKHEPLLAFPRITLLCMHACFSYLGKLFLCAAIKPAS